MIATRTLPFRERRAFREVLRVIFAIGGISTFP
jgi:hypothetical protein